MIDFDIDRISSRPLPILILGLTIIFIGIILIAIIYAIYVTGISGDGPSMTIFIIPILIIFLGIGIFTGDR